MANFDFNFNSELVNSASTVKESTGLPGNQIHKVKLVSVTANSSDKSNYLQFEFANEEGKNYKYLMFHKSDSEAYNKRYEYNGQNGKTIFPNNRELNFFMMVQILKSCCPPLLEKLKANSDKFGDPTSWEGMQKLAQHLDKFAKDGKTKDVMIKLMLTIKKDGSVNKALADSVKIDQNGKAYLSNMVIASVEELEASGKEMVFLPHEVKAIDKFNKAFKEGATNNNKSKSKTKNTSDLDFGDDTTESSLNVDASTSDDDDLPF